MVTCETRYSIISVAEPTYVSRQRLAHVLLEANGEMAAFLLWNTHRKQLDGLVQNTVREHRIDIVLLVEYPFGTSQLPGLLLADGFVKRSSPKRFGVFTRSNHRFARLRTRLNDRVALWNWTPPSGQDGLVVLLHGLDRRNYDDSTRRMFCRRVTHAVRRREGRRGNQRTIIAGDFNAHPFDSAIADADGLHAVGVRAIRGGTSRRVHGAGAAAELFYNPMWRAYGHQQHVDAGAATHYWLGRWAHELGWFMLDQVVIRPVESPRFPENELRIVTKVGAVSLLDLEGVPDLQIASDHLPLVFHWNL